VHFRPGGSSGFAVLSRTAVRLIAIRWTFGDRESVAERSLGALDAIQANA
jgi:hypothetical protein